MKKLNLIISVFLFVALIISCKKETTDARDKTIDARDKFVGTWTGNLYFSRIGSEFSVTDIITKSATNSAQIIFTSQGSTTYRVATVNGNAYTFQNFTSGVVSEVSGTYAGAGSINGNVLTESGTITSDGAPFQGNLGTWYRTLTKQ